MTNVKERWRRIKELQFEVGVEMEEEEEAEERR
jgi:hypothetical protein